MMWHSIILILPIEIILKLQQTRFFFFSLLRLIFPKFFFLHHNFILMSEKKEVKGWKQAGRGKLSIPALFSLRLYQY